MRFLSFVMPVLFVTGVARADESAKSPSRGVAVGLKEIEKITGYSFKQRYVANGDAHYTTEKDRNGLWIEAIGPEDNPKALHLWLFPQEDELEQIDAIAKFSHCLDKVASGWRDNSDWPTKSMAVARNGLTVIQVAGKVEIRVRYFDLLKSYLYRVQPLRADVSDAVRAKDPSKVAQTGVGIAVEGISEITGLKFKERKPASGDPLHDSDKEKQGLWIQAIGRKENPKNISFWIFPQDDDLRQLKDTAKLYPCLDKIAHGWRQKHWPIKAMDAARSGVQVVQDIGKVEISVVYFRSSDCYAFDVRPIRAD